MAVAAISIYCPVSEATLVGSNRLLTGSVPVAIGVSVLCINLTGGNRVEMRAYAAKSCTPAGTSTEAAMADINTLVFY